MCTVFCGGRLIFMVLKSIPSPFLPFDFLTLRTVRSCCIIWPLYSCYGRDILPLVYLFRPYFRFYLPALLSRPAMPRNNIWCKSNATFGKKEFSRCSFRSLIVRFEPTTLFIYFSLIEISLVPYCFLFLKENLWPAFLSADYLLLAIIYLSSFHLFIFPSFRLFSAYLSSYRLFFSVKSLPSFQILNLSVKKQPLLLGEVRSIFAICLFVRRILFVPRVYVPQFFSRSIFHR